MSSDRTVEAVDAVRAAQVQPERSPEEILEALNADVDRVNEQVLQLRIALRLAERAQREAMDKRDKYEREHFITEETP